MASHYIEPGTVPIIVGAVYSRYTPTSGYASRCNYSLVSKNDESMTCTLSGDRGSVYVSHM